MVVYFMEIPNLKFPFFSRITKFQQCAFRMIHWILASPDGPIKISYKRCLYVEVHCALIEYENRKAKPAHYLVQLVHFDDPNYQRQEWLLEQWELVTVPTLAIAISFYSIYHQSWPSKLAINWMRTNSNALWKNYFHL